jgi:two-component system, OmpR family, response regulator
VDSNLNKVLYAEDEPDIREIIGCALETLGGMTVETCDSGLDVVEKSLRSKPDLILLDVMMPGVDGPNAFRQLREVPELNSIPVVFITAKAQPREISQLLELGAFDVILKPFDPVKLPERLKEIWSEWNEKHQF